MALQTETHAQRLLVGDDVHLVDLAVAFHAANTTVHVGGVIEISVVWGLVNPNPWHRFTGSVALADRSEQRAGGLNDAMAVHARLRGRHIRMSGLVDVAMAITAIHPQLGNVFSVAKRHGLDRRVADPGILGRHVIGDARGRDPGENHQINDDL